MSYESEEKKLKAGMEVVEKLNFLLPTLQK